jgi:hypothetical protein
MLFTASGQDGFIFSIWSDTGEFLLDSLQGIITMNCFPASFTKRETSQDSAYDVTRVKRLAAAYHSSSSSSRKKYIYIINGST